MAVDVPQQPAVASGAFGKQDAGWKGRRWMKLHRLHVAECGDPGLQGDGGRDAFGDHRVGRHAVEPSRTTAGNSGSPGDVRCQLSAHEISHYSAVTTPAVMY